MARKKEQNLCESCRWGFDNWCYEKADCIYCPRHIPGEPPARRCMCLLVKAGEPCKDYEKYTGDKDNG